MFEMVDWEARARAGKQIEGQQCGHQSLSWNLTFEIFPISPLFGKSSM